LTPIAGPFVPWNQQGQQGAKGDTGPAGAAEGAFQSSGFFELVSIGDNYTEVGRLPLGAGNWLVSASLTLTNYGSGSIPVGCLLGNTSQGIDVERGFASLGGFPSGGDTQRMTIDGAVQFDSPGEVTIGCFGAGATAFHLQFIATRVDKPTITRTSSP
jgi:hypothetical protein